MFYRLLQLVAALCLALTLADCTNTLSPAIPPAGYSAAHNTPDDAAPLRQWYAIRLRIAADEGGNIRWDMDPLLAHELFAKLIDQHYEALPLWRFHRRAGSDAAGHQFSFLFFTDAQTATNLFAQIQNNGLVEQALAAGYLTQVITQSEAYPDAENLAATSDQHWSPSLQAQWPLFIMGVSATWLGMVDDALPAATVEEESFEQLLARYHSANEQVSEIWRNEGQHAFFHHISAIFGYQPILFGNLIQF